MRRCPRCGYNRFHAYGHVVQKWCVDECGLCDYVVNDCVTVIHEPDNQDLWQCCACGYEAAGAEFEVEEFLVEEGDSDGVAPG